MPKKSKTTDSGRLNFRVTELLHQRLLRYMDEEGHPDISETCRYLLNTAMIERYGRPVTIYRAEKIADLKVADAPGDSAH